MSPYSILLVCTDNLCRSPTAEEVLRQKANHQGLTDRVHVASAATLDFNTGEPIDFHAQKHAMRRGYDLSGLRARLLQPGDFERFDLILAMEESNLLLLRLSCPPRYKDKLRYFTQYCSDPVSQDVPDPFYGRPEDFEHVLDMIEDGCEGVLIAVKEEIDHDD
jgi:protein-tyrosine phosphatase